MSCNGFNSNQSLAAHMNKFVGETVTIFTKSGGVSGCGFTGVVLAVNCDFIRLVTRRGTAPTNPIGGPNSSCCRDLNNHDHRRNHGFTVGSVCDIPFDKIAAFCHNAV
jgi:hypothetical protein